MLFMLGIQRELCSQWNMDLRLIRCTSSLSQHVRPDNPVVGPSRNSCHTLSDRVGLNSTVGQCGRALNPTMHILQKVVFRFMRGDRGLSLLSPPGLGPLTRSRDRLQPVTAGRALKAKYRANQRELGLCRVGHVRMKCPFFLSECHRAQHEGFWFYLPNRKIPLPQIHIFTKLYNKKKIFFLTECFNIPALTQILPDPGRGAIFNLEN